MNIQQTYFQQLQKLEVKPTEINAFIGDLKHSISEAVNIPPIRELLNQGQKKGIIEGLNNSHCQGSKQTVSRQQFEARTGRRYSLKYHK